MSLQRRRGKPITIYPTKVSVDARGNTTREPDMTSPYTVRAAVNPARSSRAEVPGQQQINTLDVILPQTGVHDLDLWSRVEIEGRSYDVVTPPALHGGIERRVVNQRITVRLRTVRG